MSESNAQKREAAAKEFVRHRCPYGHDVDKTDVHDAHLAGAESEAARNAAKVERLVRAGIALDLIITNGMQDDYDSMASALGEWRAALAAGGAVE